MTEELNTAMRSCFNMKRAIKSLPLKILYTMSESFLKTLSFKKTKKCPFGFGNK